MGRRLSLIFIMILLFVIITCDDIGLRDDVERIVDGEETLPYYGWLITDWTDAEVVVDGQTHELGISTGFPQDLVIADNDRIHLIGYRQSSEELLYTYKEPGEDRFRQSYDVIRAGVKIYPFNDLDMFLRSDSTPWVSYAHFYYSGGSKHDLCLQTYNSGSGTWNSEDVYVTGDGRAYYPLLNFDFIDGENIFYVNDDSKILYNKSDSSVPADPGSAVLSDVFYSTGEVYNSNDYMLLTVPTDCSKISFMTYKNLTPVDIWFAPTNNVIYSLAAAQDSQGYIHIIAYTVYLEDLGSPPPLDDPRVYFIRYISNSSGVWEEKAYIQGTTEMGPFHILNGPPDIVITQDKDGDDHVHIMYTVLSLPTTFYIWYAYYDDIDGQLHPVEESIDLIHTNSLQTYANMVSDSHGNLHVIYTWQADASNRTLMYLKGSPEEQQN